jgi:hypothetical protein
VKRAISALTRIRGAIALFRQQQAGFVFESINPDLQLAPLKLPSSCADSIRAPKLI